MLTVDEIRKALEGDAASRTKKQARTGLRYYEADHDINQYRIFFYDADGRLREDKSKSNIKISHPFFTELVDQEVQYMLSGKDGFVRSDIPALQRRLDQYFNDSEDFMAELYEVVTGCIVKGSEYAYAYKGKEGRTCFQCADSLGVVEVPAREAGDGRGHIIFSYLDRGGRDGGQLRRIQVWDERQTWFYVQEGSGEIELDGDRETNPRPHILYEKDGDANTYFEDYGMIPFFRLDNGRRQYSGLRPIKALIDDYDLMSCGLSNNIQDTNEALYVVKGFEGENLDEMITNMKFKKHIGLEDSGEVDIKTIDIPYQAREAKLEMDEKNIYRFGMGFNAADHGEGNITNVVIKSRYALLDLKCNKLEIRLRQFLRKLLKIVLAEINEADGTGYQQEDVYFVFERETITNAADNAQIHLAQAQTRQTEINTLLNLQEVLGDENMVQLIAEQLDMAPEDLKAKMPRPEDDPLLAAQAALVRMPIDPQGA